MIPNNFDELYTARAGDIYRMAYFYMRNHADAEDIVSEVFMKYLKKQPVFENEQHEKAWFFKVTGNYCKDQLKKKKADPEDLDQLENVSGIAFNNHDKELLEEILALPFTLRQVVYLHYYLGYKLKEISKITRTSERTLKTRLAKARDLLKLSLTDNL